MHCFGKFYVVRVQIFFYFLWYFIAAYMIYFHLPYSCYRCSFNFITYCQAILAVLVLHITFVLVFYQFFLFLIILGLLATALCYVALLTSGELHWTHIM